MNVFHFNSDSIDSSEHQFVINLFWGILYHPCHFELYTLQFNKNQFVFSHATNVNFEEYSIKTLVYKILTTY